MTHHLTPYRRRSASAHAGFEAREIDVDMDICRWCGGLVPAAETQRVKHEDWEQRIANRFTQLLDRVAILEAATAQLPGSRSSDPDPKSPPTPAQEATQAGRARVEGSNPQRTQQRNPYLERTPGGSPDPGTHPGGPPGTPPSQFQPNPTKPGVVEPPPDATSPPGGQPTPPRLPSGGTKRGNAPVDPERADLAAFEQTLTGDDR